MWATEHTAETAAAPRAVWAALRDLHTGQVRSASGDRFELHGPFEVGSELSVTPQGQDTFRSRITELVPERVYADETAFGDLTLVFRHTLVPRGDGGSRLTHRLEISGAGSEQAGPVLGEQISADFPGAMEELLEMASQARSETG